MSVYLSVCLSVCHLVSQCLSVSLSNCHRYVLHCPTNAAKREDGHLTLPLVPTLSRHPRPLALTTSVTADCDVTRRLSDVDMAQATVYSGGAWTCRVSFQSQRRRLAPLGSSSIPPHGVRHSLKPSKNTAIVEKELVTKSELYLSLW